VRDSKEGGDWARRGGVPDGGLKGGPRGAYRGG